VIQQSNPKSRIFVCCAEKDPSKAACKRGEGERVAADFKEELNKQGKSTSIWVTRTRCQGYCDPNGTAILFSATGKQYSDVTFEEAQELFKQNV
jgi:(2Fe-2S) ferredoxin